MSREALFRSAVNAVFGRWTGLQLAIENGMGGRDPRQTAETVAEWVARYCSSTRNLDAGELRLILDDIMNDEFDTICEDNSTQEVAESLVRYAAMCRSDMVAEMTAEVASLGPCRLEQSRRVFDATPIRPDEIIHEDDDNDDEDEPDSRQDEPMEEDVEPGWTVVRTKRK